MRDKNENAHLSDVERHERTVPFAYVPQSVIDSLGLGFSGLYEISPTLAPRHRPDCTVPLFTAPTTSAAVREPATLPPDIIESLLAIGSVEWGQTNKQNDGKHLDDFEDTLCLTRQHFGIEDKETAIHGLYLAGTGIVLAHTGMSPNSPQHARILAGAWNHLVDIAKASSTLHPSHGDQAPEIAAAAEAERNQWKDAVDEAAADAFTMGMDAERLRVIEIVKHWAGSLRGGEYLQRNLEWLLKKIVTPSRTIQHAEYNGKTIIVHPNIPPHIWDGKEMKRLPFDGETEVADQQTENGLWRFWNEKAQQQAVEITALKEESRRLRNKVSARALTDNQLDDEDAAIDAVIAGGFGEGGGSPGEWWYERADEIAHERKRRKLEKELADHNRGVST